MIGKQQRPEPWPGAFGIGPADHEGKPKPQQFCGFHEPTSLWDATREIGLYSATASAPLVLERADRPWAHTVIEKQMSAVVFWAPPVGFEMRLEPTTADRAFR